MRDRLNQLHHDERAQVFVLSTVSIIAVIFLLGLPVNIGWTIQRRIKLQNAADAAAYSAALMEADTLSAVAWLNNTEAYLYARLTEHVVDFNAWSVHSLMVHWGEKTGAGQPPDDHIVEGHNKFEEFKKSGRIKYIYNGDERTIELWIKTIRGVKEEMLAALPRMMRHEAMRMAYLNMGDTRVNMAFFPDDNTTPALNFNPRDSGSFTMYPKWDMKSNPFVDRSLQIGKELGFEFLTTSGDPRFGSLDGSNPQEGQDWFDIYKGEPVKGGDGKYTTFSKTIDCWHPKDTSDSVNHDSMPVGHWHLNHRHVDYECYHIPEKHHCIHQRVSITHTQGHEPNRGCMELTGQYCGRDYQIPILSKSNMGLADDVGATKIKESRTHEILIGEHHYIRFCPTCNTDGKGEFPESGAPHSVSYQPRKYQAIKSVESDQMFGLSVNSQVRVYLEDVLTKEYGDWLGINVNDNYHLIERDTFSPEPNKVPTVWLKDEKEHLFRWGITVLLVYPQEGPMFGTTKVYQTRKSMAAVASAKVGMVGDGDSETPLPKRLICGVGEQGGYTSDAMVDKVLTFKGKNEKMMNLMYTNWGAKVIPIDKSSPAGSPIQHVFNTGRLYQWQDGKVAPAAGSLDAAFGQSAQVNWNELQDVIVH